MKYLVFELDIKHQEWHPISTTSHLPATDQGGVMKDEITAKFGQGEPLSVLIWGNLAWYAIPGTEE